MRILIVLTSHDRLGNTGRKTGFWFEELAAPYFVFRDAGVEITLASPKGGQPPLDPKSNEPEVQTDDTRRFEQDPTATRALANTLKLSEIDQADYDSVFFPGGHGPLWDLTNDRNALSLIEDMLVGGKTCGARLPCAGNPHEGQGTEWRAHCDRPCSHGVHRFRRSRRASCRRRSVLA